MPEVDWPLHPTNPPATLEILDLIEFCFRVVAEPTRREHHTFYGHHHLTFNRIRGQAKFRDEMSEIFARNKLAYELDAEGRVIRLAPDVLRHVLLSPTFQTGDGELDSLLETARGKYLDPNPIVRHESLEKLWDAWERLKSLEHGKDKAASASALLNQVSSEPRFREALNREARELTRLGNTFTIRHSEKEQAPLGREEYVDYLFHRLFTMIRLILKATGRGG